MAQPETAAVLVVDASRTTGRRALAYLKESGYGAEWVDTAEKAFNRLDARHFDVLVTELTVGRIDDGMRLMSVAKARNPDVCVVFTTRAPDIEHATDAMRQGAYDFQVKPLNLAKLEAVIQRGLAYQRLVLEQVALKQRLDERFGLGSLAGQSRAMARVYTAVRQAGPLHAPVLLYGEAGTGKDAIAQAIHNSGPRRDGPFVKLDCAALPEAVLEAELFGGGERTGRLELAEQGTLYLDNADALPPRLQARLRGAVKMDARIVTAVNAPAHGHDVPESPLAGPDTIRIGIPALRERREDIPLLLRRCLAEAAEHSGAPTREITPRAAELLAAYDWPGNLRELRNTVEAMAAAARGAGPLDISAVPEALRRAASVEEETLSIPIGTPMREIERLAIEATLRASGYKKEQCAKTLGIGLRTLYRKLEQYGLR